MRGENNILIEMKDIKPPELMNILLRMENKKKLTDAEIDILCFFSQHKEQDYRDNVLKAASIVIGSQEGRNKKRLMMMMLASLSDEYSGYFALKGLTGLLNKSFVPLLGSILMNYRMPLIRIQAVEALQAIRTNSIIPYLEYALNDRHNVVRDYCANALVSLNSTRSISKIKDRLKLEKNMDTKVGFWGALYGLTDETKWFEKLIKALSYPDSVVIDHASSNLGMCIEEGMLEINDVLPHLKDAYRKQKDKKARTMLKKHINKLERLNNR